MNGCYSSVYVAPVGSPSKPSFMVEEPSPEVQRLMQQAKDYQRQMQRNDGSAQVKKSSRQARDHEVLGFICIVRSYRVATCYSRNRYFHYQQFFVIFVV